MAKKKARTKRAPRRSSKKAASRTRRISTRRLQPPQADGMAAGLETAAAADGNTLHLTLDLLDVSQKPISDPETFFTFRRVAASRQIGDQIAMPLTGPAPEFDVPAFPSEALVCEIDPKRYRFVQSPVFLGTPGTNVREQRLLFREPAEWTARFTRWQALNDSFDDLKTVLRRSPNVSLFKGGESLGRIAESAYDALAGAPIALAKAALLNSYARLNRMADPISRDPWFSFVDRIIAIGRERFLAFVDPVMAERVQFVHDHIDQFRADYERTPAENHRGNVPVNLQSRISRMVSIKSSHDKGNVQLTITFLNNPDEALFDSDIDENGALLAHTFDLLKHKFSGGTHPYDIHELLVYEARNAQSFDIGYRLE